MTDARGCGTCAALLHEMLYRGWDTGTVGCRTRCESHGLGGNRAQLLLEAGFLSRRGHGVLLLDSRASGESDGDLATWGDLERLDIRAALDFLSARPDVEKEMLGLYGFSVGAVALVAAEGQRVRAVALGPCWTSLADELRDKFHSFGWLSTAGAGRRGHIELPDMHADPPEARMGPRVLDRPGLDGHEIPNQHHQAEPRPTARAATPPIPAPAHPPGPGRFHRQPDGGAGGPGDLRAASDQDQRRRLLHRANRHRRKPDAELFCSRGGHGRCLYGPRPAFLQGRAGSAAAHAAHLHPADHEHEHHAAQPPRIRAVLSICSWLAFTRLGEQTPCAACYALPRLGEARRIDEVVIKDGKAKRAIEVTSEAADKTAQENRVRGEGGSWIIPADRPPGIGTCKGR